MTARFMMYFKPPILNELRVLSRILNIAMVDFVDAALRAYIFAREHKMGASIPKRDKKRYVGPRNDTTEKRIRYVMRLDKDVIERVRDAAYFDSRRFSQVCDDALAGFIRFTKKAKSLDNVWLSRSDVEAVRGRKSSESVQQIVDLLQKFKSAEKNAQILGSKPKRKNNRDSKKPTAAKKAYRV
ncbi:MAG: hypothetical protein JW920_06060 [Deltaproteobacteria bacterium]|nr:hypothetical protein [Deltaproteobacteria bacterium]